MNGFINLLLKTRLMATSKPVRQGHKRYRKGKRVKAEAIKNAVSIDDKPAIVDRRERFGDWEIDTC